MPAAASYRLIERRGPQPNQVHDLVEAVSNIGRDITNQVVINDREVSRHHSRITISGDDVMIEDLGSTNGTFVNGRRLTGAVALNNGDMIGLGETISLGFELKRDMPGVTAAAPYQPAPQPMQENFSPPIQQPAVPPQQINAYEPARPAAAPQQQNYGQAPQQIDVYQQGSSAPIDPYQQQSVAPSYDPYYQQPAAGNYAPPQAPPGYDSEGYPVTTGSSTRWFLIGCIGFFFLACMCTTVISLLVIDAMNLWCQLPILSNIMGTLGFCSF
ncbi:hypothetical protein MASR2M15_06970 [Anaerolineales bacterium]